MVLKKSEKEQPRVRDGLHCDLCGCSAPAVRCEKCSHQIFCLSCDDMYHRHPKRRTHARKAVNIPPPPPPKPVKDADPTRLPVPPPRRRKSQPNQKSVPSSPLLSRKFESQNPPLPKKEFSFIDKVGSLRRFIGRPLPPVPKDEAPERPPKTGIWKQVEQNSADKNQITNENDDETANSYSNMRKKAETLVPNSNDINAMYENDISEKQPNFQPTVNNTMNKTDQISSDWDRSSQERQSNSGVEEWNNNSSKQSLESQFSYPSTLTKSEVDSGIQMGFQGFPTLPKRPMFPSNQYMDRSGAQIMPMNHQSGSACNLTNTNMPTMPQHPHLMMHMPQGQPFQGMGYMQPNHMPRNDGQFPNPCPLPYSMPWMAHPQDPYKYYMDPSMQSYPVNVKRIPSSSSINFSPTGSEAGYRLNSYTSMGHLHNPMMDGLPHHYPPPYAQNNRPPSPAHSVRSARLHKAQSVASDVGNSVYYHGARRATAHGFPFSGRHSNVEGTSSEEDYFSAGASDDEDFRSIRSGPSGYGKGHVPSRNWQCEHCTFVNSPGSRICNVCCKTTARPKSMVSRKRRGASGTKTPSSSDSLPPIVPKQNHRKRSTPTSPLQDMPFNDEAVNDDNVESDTELSKAVDSNLKISENKGKDSETIEGLIESGAQGISTETDGQNSADANSDAINISTSELKPANEKNKNLHTNTASTGTSPPPQHSATQTGLMEEMLSDEFSQRPIFRSTSRTSLSGADREIIPHLRRTASVHIGPNDSWNGPYGHRSSSRASLFGGSRDTSPLRSFRGDIEYNGYRDRRFSYEPLNRTDYYLSLEELIERRRQETMRVQGFELVRLLREAEQNNFNADDLQVALNHCGSQNPIQWLQDNWKNMIDTVVTLVSNYGKDKEENDIGVISAFEGKEALRLHKGNIWAAVTDCVEIRQKKFAELKSRGEHFVPEEIVAALTANQGNVEAAYLELSKNSMKPFHMKIWGPPLGVENESGSKKTSSKSPSSPRSKSPISPSVITGTLTIPFGARTSMEAGSSGCEAAAGSTIAASSSTSTTTVTVTTATSQPTVTSSVHIENNRNEALNTETKDLPHPENEKTATESSFSSIIQNIIAADEGSNETTTSWSVATSGGGSAVGGALIQEVGNDNVDFKPATTSCRLSRTGSFTGGSYKAKDSSDVSENTATNRKVDESDDLYVTVQWASGQKPVNLTKRPPTPDPIKKKFNQEGNVNILEKSDGETVYSSVQLLAAKNSSKALKVKPPKIPHSRNLRSVASGNEEKNSPLSKLSTPLNKDMITDAKPSASSSKSLTSNVDDKKKNDKNKKTEAADLDLSESLNTYATIEFIKSQEQTEFSKSVNNSLVSCKEAIVTDNSNINLVKNENSNENTHSVETYTLTDTVNQNRAFENTSPLPKSLNSVKNLELSDNKTNFTSSSPNTPTTDEKKTVSSNANNSNKNSNSDITLNLKPIDQTGDIKENIQNQQFSLTQKANSAKNSSQYEFERCARMLLAEGKVSTYEEGELAVKLLELKFEEQDAFTAASECNDLYSAVAFLQQECELCTNKYPMGKMISMLYCIHRCCRDCACDYFSFQIRDKNIMEAVCPFCSEPDLSDDNIAQEYFNHLDIMLKNLVKPEVHELFQRKLRDRALMKDPNFHWCSQCSSGFIAAPNTKRLTCPDCHVVTCAQCRKLWEKQHEGISCELFSKWKEENDPEFQAKGLEKHLEENGIDCPNCRFRYSLAKGGCMHFRCLQCKYDFCSGCGHPFKLGQKCNFSDQCVKLGLHAHHPRNCLFYLRDKEPADLQKLLTENNISFDTEVPPGSASALTEQSIRKCPVMEQKDVGLKDDICGKEVEEGYAGLCRLHYVEYLVTLINKHAVDPVTVFDVIELKQELRRRNKIIPEQDRQSDSLYHDMLIKMIKEQIPLDETART